MVSVSWVVTALALALGHPPAHAMHTKRHDVKASAASTAAGVRWLCRPQMADDPCVGSQLTTVTSPSGATSIADPAVPAPFPVDCFYVYPTVSNQPTVNATATAAPEVQSIAEFQAQRFSTECSVYAPLYRQVTVAGVSISSQTHDTAPYETAYNDVAAAFASYIANDNHGRPFVLIGHSQGSRILRALLQRVINPNPSLRAQLVTAIIPGANVTVGEDPKIPDCAQPGEDGCIVAYSTFDETPPSNTRFGGTDTDPVGGALNLPQGQVVCTDPTLLSGTPGVLESAIPTRSFAPGIIATLLLELYGGPAPTASTPWLVPRDHYTVRCENVNGAEVLMTSPVDGARHLNPSPDPTWGTHLVDINLALGNLLTIVNQASTTWLASHRAPHAGRHHAPGPVCHARRHRSSACRHRKRQHR